MDRARAGKLSSVVVGIAGADGTFHDASHYSKGGLEIVRRGNVTNVSLAATPSGYETEDTAGAKSLTDLHDPFNYAHDGVVQSPFPYEMLRAILATNGTHAAAVETKATDYAYNGWYLENTPECVRLLESGEVEKDEVDKARTFTMDWLRSCNDSKNGRSIADLCWDLAMDHESSGMCAFEARRNAAGLLARTKPVPFRTIRRLMEKEARANKATWLQRRYNRKIYFSEFGANVFLSREPGNVTQKPENEFDALSAPITDFPKFDSRQDYVNWRKGALLHPEKRDKAASWKDAQTELYVMARRPFTLSEIYGTPSGYQAIGSVLAQRRIEAYNLSFFTSKGVPQYAIIIEGLTSAAAAPTMIPASDEPSGSDPLAINTPDDIAALKKTITEFFTSSIQSNDRSALVVTAFGDTKVKFERLSSEKIEASFDEYDKACTNKIRMAHRVPGAAMGIVETANLGSGRDTTQMERYRDHIVRPGQQLFATMVTELIRVGLLIPYFEFKFHPLTLKEEERHREYFLKAMSLGGITPNEFRDQVDYPPVQNDSTADSLIIPGAMSALVIGRDDSNAGAALQKAIRNANQFESWMKDILLSHLDEETLSRVANENGFTLKRKDSQEET